MLSYDSGYDSPSLPIDLGEAVTSGNVDQTTQPVANQNNSSGFSFDNAVKGVLNLFDSGLQVYKNVTDTIGTTQAQAQQKKTDAQATVVSAAHPSVIFGLSNTQLLLIAGGLAALLIIPRLVKR